MPARRHAWPHEACYHPLSGSGSPIIVFPLFDLEATLGENIAVGGYTLALIWRSFVPRRVFEAIWSGSMADVDGGTVRAEQNTGIGLPQIALLHAGRAHRHARHG